MATPSPSSLRSSPVGLIVFVTLIGAAGFGILGHALYSLPSTPYPLGWMAVGGLALIAGRFALKVPGAPMYLSISDTFFITSALLFGPGPATVTIAIDSLFISLRNKKNAVYQSIFNATSCAIALWVAAQVFFAIDHTSALVDVKTPPDARMMLGLACMAGVYFILNSGFVATAVSLQKGLPGLTVWRQHFAIVSLNHCAAASAAFFLIILMRFVTPVAIGAIVPLLVIVYLAMRSWLGRIDDAEQHVDKVNRLYLSTVSALATAIEAKDGVTSDHIHRVQAYALGLAGALKISDPQTLQAIEAAALLHDTGKIAIPEHILNKPGRLTSGEMETMQSHVDIGADILSSIDFPYPVVPIVESHHENWDGSGYPRGLSGEQIPIGARILSVVDCFDALTSDRPYRPAMADAEAIGIIEQRRGNFYDPGVVDAFVRVYRDITVATPQPRLQNAMRRIRGVRAAATAATSAVDQAPVVPPSVDSSDELLAFVSLARITAGTPTVKDIGALAWGHLRQLAPGATMALFTVDAGRQSVVAMYTAGPRASDVAGTVIGIGERITGWVAANARTMINAETQLDLGLERAHGRRFATAVPLVAHGSVAGVLTLYAAEPFADDRSRRLEMIAPQLAVAIAAALAADTISTGGAPTEADRGRLARAELRVVARR